MTRHAKHKNEAGKLVHNAKDNCEAKLFMYANRQPKNIMHASDQNNHLGRESVD